MAKKVELPTVGTVNKIKKNVRACQKMEKQISTLAGEIEKLQTSLEEFIAYVEEEAETESASEEKPKRTRRARKPAAEEKPKRTRRSRKPAAEKEEEEKPKRTRRSRKSSSKNATEEKPKRTRRSRKAAPKKEPVNDYEDDFDDDF